MEQNQQFAVIVQYIHKNEFFQKCYLCHVSQFGVPDQKASNQTPSRIYSLMKPCQTKMSSYHTLVWLSIRCDFCCDRILVWSTMLELSGFWSEFHETQASCPTFVHAKPSYNCSPLTTHYILPSNQTNLSYMFDVFELLIKHAIFTFSNQLRFLYKLLCLVTVGQSFLRENTKLGLSLPCFRVTRYNHN